MHSLEEQQEFVEVKLERSDDLVLGGRIHCFFVLRLAFNPLRASFR